MVNDPVGDFLSRIRNAQERKHDTVVVPHTNMIESIAKILKDSQFILDYKIIEKEPQKEIEVTLKFVNKLPAITVLERVSKPGIRKYRGYKNIKKIKNGLGIAIFSTPMGVVTGDEAVKNKIGGEYICNIY